MRGVGEHLHTPPTGSSWDSFSRLARSRSCHFHLCQESGLRSKGVGSWAMPTTTTTATDARSQIPTPNSRATDRLDRWWLEPLLIVTVLHSFSTYSAMCALQKGV